MNDINKINKIILEKKLSLIIRYFYIFITLNKTIMNYLF